MRLRNEDQDCKAIFFFEYFIGWHLNAEPYELLQLAKTGTFSQLPKPGAPSSLNKRGQFTLVSPPPRV
jgi:hypothetical protein